MFFSDDPGSFWDSNFSGGELAVKLPGPNSLLDFQGFFNILWDVPDPWISNLDDSRNLRDGEKYTFETKPFGTFWEGQGCNNKLLILKWFPLWIQGRQKTSWWFLMFFYFHPYQGKWSNLTNIFQLGWNHQLEKTCKHPGICDLKLQMKFAAPQHSHEWRKIGHHPKKDGLFPYHFSGLLAAGFREYSTYPLDQCMVCLPYLLFTQRHFLNYQHNDSMWAMTNIGCLGHKGDDTAQRCGGFYHGDEITPLFVNISGKKMFGTFFSHPAKQIPSSS